MRGAGGDGGWRGERGREEKSGVASRARVVGDVGLNLGGRAW